jgi:hypothetical protein
MPETEAMKMPIKNFIRFPHINRVDGDKNLSIIAKNHRVTTNGLSVFLYVYLYCK